MERWQYKIEFNYKTMSHAKLILQSPGVEREDFPGRKDMCYSFQAERQGPHRQKWSKVAFHQSQSSPVEDHQQLR